MAEKTDFIKLIGISLWLITLGIHLTSGEYVNRILILSDFTV